ncbi:uncharacterized protein BP5553_10551 [Venustampulla echinocandica]|uniref:Rhodopsin domain-containing protein n=1 Tax=Venustampulla echinocandica TaxID=2656787 RepID=A0A370T8U7_9HELO|nr:uncharacterized protein BP5553_10551 [Venustampulla echinocandica]RDL29924.1 hypothetical protein BP5553_10551 [Venustampulla echinocandica]
MADAGPGPGPVLLPVSDAAHHAARVFVAITVPLLTLSLATLTTRIVLKLRSGLRPGWDDGLIVLGCLLAVVDWALLLAVLARCTNQSASFITLPMLEQTIKFGIIATSVWNVSIACIKCSVACLLLRFPHRLGWRMVLYAVIGVVVACSTGSFIFNLLQCQPLAAAWDVTIVGARCVGPAGIRIGSNVSSGVNIATDFILSLFPLTFLPKLRRPGIEKLLVAILMAMGLTASAASIAKAVLIRSWGTTDDWFPIGFAISTWTCVEMFLGIIAACSPSLKPVVQRFLTWFGIDFSHSGAFSFFGSIHQDPDRADTSPRHVSARNPSEKSPSQNAHFLPSVGISHSTPSPDGDGQGMSESGSEEFKKGSEGSHGSIHII